MEDKKAKILIVDDEPEIVDTLKHFLSLKGYAAIGALCGEEALNILDKENMDIILLDIMMPGLKGTEVAKIVKDKYPSIKVIVLTAYPDKAEVLAKNNLLEGLLLKPVSIQEIYQKLVDVLQQNEYPVLDAKVKQGIKARVLLITAKLLFVEPSPDVCNSLNSHFKNLSNKGENYELGFACNSQEALEKLKALRPDILIFNMAYFNSLDKDFIEEISQSPYKPKEIIIYKTDSSGIIGSGELERLTKVVQISSLKNGLIEIKWVEI